jgi:hypothetical protein
MCVWGGAEGHPVKRTNEDASPSPFLVARDHFSLIC